MPNKFLVIAGTMFLGACAAECEDPRTDQSGNANEPQSASSWQESYLALGKQAYDRSCAECHDAGLQGAPAIGDQEAWSSRSPLWSAVLLEHAKSGYLEMPPKGGHTELSDRAVEAAGEYMLSETYPELLRD